MQICKKNTNFRTSMPKNSNHSSVFEIFRYICACNFSEMKGEFISLAVAVLWTICALFSEAASRRVGSLSLNLIRMILSLIFLLSLLFIQTGVPFPVGTNMWTWFYLILSGVVGYVIGDYCLFRCYIEIGSRYGQLLMTLAPIAAAFTSFVFVGQKITVWTMIAMVLVIGGIAITLLGRKSDGQISSKGVVMGIIAGVCQGVGLVLSYLGIVNYQVSLEAGQYPQAVYDVIPFASTSIRAMVGLVGFSVWILLSGNQHKFSRDVRDRKAILLALGATLTGPFLGVSLSLMATIYTSAGIAQTIMAMTPVFILVPSYLIFKQKITFKEVIGAVVAVAGVSLLFVM